MQIKYLEHTKIPNSTNSDEAIEANIELPLEPIRTNYLLSFALCSVHKFLKTKLNFLWDSKFTNAT